MLERVRTFEVLYIDGSQDLIDADFYERAGDEEHFVTNRAGQLETWIAVPVDRVIAVQVRE